MRKEETARNRAIVVLRKLDPEVYSFGELGRIFKVQKHVAHKVFLRDKDKYHLPLKVQ